MEAVIEATPTLKKSLISRLGMAGFLFFFVKGLLWLIVPAIVVAIS